MIYLFVSLECFGLQSRKLIVMVAERTSWLSFGMVVMLICAFPARPLLGSILHHPIERVSITEAVHSLLAVNDIVAFPPADEKGRFKIFQFPEL